MWLECNWNKSWTPVDTLDSCNWVQCLNPPDPPEEHLLELDWDGLPVEFNSTVSYVCQSDETYFLWDNTQLEFNVTCLNGGFWDDPDEWPICVECKHPFRASCNISCLCYHFSCELHRASCQASSRNMGMGR